RLLTGWTTVDFRIGRAGGRQAVGCRHAAGTADLGRHRLISGRGPMECRWGCDPRRPTLAGVARPVQGGDRGGRSQGGEGEATTMNSSGEKALFALALEKPADKR